MNAWMSRFVTRPPFPVPGTCDGSMPCSAAIRATTGETNDRPFSGALGAPARAPAAGAGCSASGAGSGGVVAPSVAGALAASAAGCVAGSGAGGDAPASPPIRARTVPTSTVAPSSTRISVTTPAAGEGTSVSTLSVEISSSVSSASTVSPTCLFHFVIVPSDTDTPICGMTTSTAVFGGHQ